MAKFIHPPFLAVLVMLVCLSMLPPAFAAGPVRIARTLQAQDVYTGQRQLRRDRARKLTDVNNSGSQPPLHMFETKSIFDKERRGEFSEEQREQVGGAAASSAIPIQYHGGPVMSGETLNVYLIYYGFWPAGIGQDVIENFIQSLSLGSSDEQGGPGDPKVVYDHGSHGKRLGGKTPWRVVMSNIGDGRPFPYDANGIYLILAGNNVEIPGFCKSFCAWHAMHLLNWKPVAYSLVGHHGLCPTSCGVQQTSPNGKPWLDAMVSAIAHEIAEVATNPDARSGWFDAHQREGADKCSYHYGVTQTTKNEKGEDSEYNLVGLNNMKFLVQQNWDLSTWSWAEKMDRAGEISDSLPPPVAFAFSARPRVPRPPPSLSPPTTLASRVAIAASPPVALASSARRPCFPPLVDLVFPLQSTCFPSPVDFAFPLPSTLLSPSRRPCFPPPVDLAFPLPSPSFLLPITRPVDLSSLSCRRVNIALIPAANSSSSFHLIRPLFLSLSPMPIPLSRADALVFQPALVSPPDCAQFPPLIALSFPP
ncbi:unnamed protein product [Closterium sp. NIES-65]|nr:unnamed protein product [Closterium sp. NIES-65]